MGLFSKMRAFINVVDAEGFSAAARKFNSSKALLSKHVRELEDEMGVRLLNRTTRQLSLTEAGHKYYVRATAILKDVDDLSDSISGAHTQARGRIKVSAARTFADAPIGRSFIDFLLNHPAIHLDLHLDDRFVDLVEEEFDLAIRLATLEDSSLIARKLCHLETVTLASPELLNKVGEPKTPQDLATRPCLVDRNNRSFNHWTFCTADGTGLSVTVSGPLEVNSPVMTRNAAISGLGFARLPRFVAEEEIKSGKLVCVLQDYSPNGGGIYAVYPHRRYLSARVRLLVDELAKWFKDH